MKLSCINFTFNKSPKTFIILRAEALLWFLYHIHVLQNALVFISSRKWSLIGQDLVPYTAFLIHSNIPLVTSPKCVGFIVVTFGRRSLTKIKPQGGQGVFCEICLDTFFFVENYVIACSYKD